MMKMINKWLFNLLLLFLPVKAFACYPAKVPLEKRVERSTEIYVGTVIKVINEVINNNSTKIINSVSSLPKAYALEIEVSEMLKGENKEAKIEAKILDCGSGKATLGDKVIVFFNGEFWYVSIFNQNTYSDLLELKPNHTARL